MPLHKMIAKLREKWSGRVTPRRSSRLKSRQALHLEQLESRDLMAVSIAPKIIAVTPPNGGSLVETASPNVVKVTYSEAMAANAATASNYLLFDPSGNAVTISSVTPDAVLPNTYDVAFPAGEPAGAYSLFVKGDMVDASAGNGGLPLAGPGQLVVANSGAGSNSVSTVSAPDGFNPPPSTLGATQTYAMGPNAGGFFAPTPSSVAIADFNGDGFLDLAIASQSGPGTEVDIYNGKASGGFDGTPDTRLIGNPGDDFPTAILAYSASTTAPSGFADLAVIDSLTHNVDVFVNTGTAGANSTFKPVVVDASGATTPVAFASGDFNNDGTTDLAVLDGTADGNNNFNIDFLPGQGGGTFGAPVKFAVGSTANAATTLQNPTSIAVGSLKTAASTDIAVGGSNGVETIFGNGSFAPTIGQLINSTTNPTLLNPITAVKIGQLDGDSTAGDDGDIAALSGGSVEVIRNLDLGNGSMNTAAPNILVVGAVGNQLRLAPQTAGGKADIVVLTTAANEVTVLHNTSASAAVSFAAPAHYTVDTDPVGIAVGDLNGDVTPDIVTVNDGSGFGGGTFSVLRNNGDGTYGVPTVLTAAAAQPDSIAVGDLNGDNVPDLVVADKAANQVTVYLGSNTTPGTYSAGVTYSIQDAAHKGSSPVSVVLADLNGAVDGNGNPILDIITANAGDNTVSVLLGHGDGTFGVATTYAVGQGPTQVVAGLFNSSGKVSLAVAHNGGGSDILARGVTLLLGNGDGTFQAAQEILPNVAATAIVAGNFTEAAGMPLDLAVADGVNGQVELLRNNGMGVFTHVASDTYAVGASPSALAVGDFNRDGFQDVVAVSSDATGAAQQIAVLLNSASGGFAAAVYTALPFNFPIFSVAVANLNGFDYPDLVVGLTGATTGAFNAPPADANLYSLIGNGDGSFSLPVPYMTGAKSNKTTVAVASNPLVLASTFTLVTNIVDVDLVKNGNFEGRDLNGTAGTFTGWNTVKTQNSRGGWYLQSGTLSPLSQTTVLPPVATGTVANNYQAMADESNLQPLTIAGGTPFADTPLTYAGSNFLYQDITLPPTTSPASISFNLNLYLNSAFNNGTSLGGGKFGGFVTPGDGSLDFNNASNNPDQQVRVDFVLVGDPNQIDSATPITNGVLYQTDGNTPQTASIVLTTAGNSAAAMQLSAQLSSILANYHGQTIRLRISVVNNQGRLTVGVDNVSFKIQYTDTTAPVLNGPQLRNPGHSIAYNGSTIFSTTDPTLTGSVSDDGGVKNIKEVVFFTLDPTVGDAFVGPAAIDANGFFTVQLPGLVASLTPITVYSRVYDNAGNVGTGIPLTFVYQGPSTTDWQDAGPGPINVKGISNAQYSTVVGRINSVLVDPTDPSGNTYITAGDNGGIWRTRDGGVDWTPTTDFLVDANLNPINAPIGAMGGAIDKTGVEDKGQFIIYAGMGDSDVEPSSRAGNGILLSVNGGQSWAVAGNSETVLANARISSIAVDPNNTGVAYAAVESGGVAGPGVYKTTDGGGHWVNVFSTAGAATLFSTANNIFGAFNGTFSGKIFANGASLASVTSMVIDPFNSLELTIGVGNIGLVPLGNATAGVYRSVDGGGTWHAVIGGSSVALNDSLPGAVDLNGNLTPAISSTIGRVTVAQASGIGNDASTLYVLVSTPPAANPTPGGSINYGNTQAGTLDDPEHGGTTALNTRNIYGLYKSGNVGLDITAFTHVQVREEGGPPAPDIPGYFDINFSGVDASNTGALIVDPTDPNVVYVGASNEYPGNVGGDGLLRIDTGNMVDTAANTTTGNEGTINTGDDRTKRLIANDSDNDNNPNVYEYPTASDQGYTGEGVSWLNLTINAFENIGFPANGNSPFGNFSQGNSLPPNITSVAIDGQGRIVFGTEQGLYRLVYQGAGYDYTSGGNGNGIVQRTEALVKSPGQTLATVPSTLITLTEINGNLQIADLTSAALDPTIPGRLYTTQYNTGAAVTSGSLTYNSSGLLGGGTNGGSFDGGGNDFMPDGDRVVVAQPDPTAPAGTLNTIYEVFAYGIKGVQEAFQLVTSTQGGTADSITNLPTTNFDFNDNAGYLPVLSISPNKIFAFVPSAGKFEYLDKLLFASDRVYVSPDSGAEFTPVGSGPLQAGAYITAAQFAPSNDQVIWAGTNLGEVFVTVLNPSSQTYTFQAAFTGLPAGQRINSITVDPTDSTIAYVTETTAAGIGQVYMTSNNGASWKNITGNLPALNAYSLVTDPRPQPGAGAPVGFLYLGTSSGVYFSVDKGAHWGRLGAGLPNVAVTDLQFNQALSTLVAATMGRGAFEISTDYEGAYVAVVNPATPVNGYITPLSSVTVTFNKSISTFPASAVSIMGPYGPITEIGVPTDVSSFITGSPNPHNAWKITFAPQTADGVYTFTIGPNVLDQLGRPMDQNGNGINGEAADAFSFKVALNSTDDGQFVTGQYNDEFGRAADTNGFINFLAPIDAARNAVLSNYSFYYVRDVGRPQLVQDLYGPSGPSILGVGDLLQRAASPAEIAVWQTALAQGASYEQIIQSLASSAEFFGEAGVGGLDSNFVTQVYNDLLHRAPGSYALNTVFLPQLDAAENSARFADASVLLAGQAYQTLFIQNAYQQFLPTHGAPTSGEIANILNLFSQGYTQEQVISTLLGSQEYYFYDAPAVVGGGATASPTTLIQAMYAQLFPNYNVSAGEVNFWVNQLNTGAMTATQIANYLDTTNLYRFGTNDTLTVGPQSSYNGSVDRYYVQYLGRHATLADLQSWQAVYAANPNFRDETLIASLVGSDEYFGDNTTAGQPLPSQDQQFVDALYTSVLGSTNPTAESTRDLPFLAAQESAARGAVVQNLLSSLEYRGDVVSYIYQSDLSRPAGAGELAFWEPYIGQAGAANGPNGDEQLVDAIFSSQEFFQDAPVDANHLHTNLTWLLSLTTKLHTPVNAATTAQAVYNDGNIALAYGPQRLTAIQQFQTSLEHYGDVTTTNYELYLRRAPSPFELSLWNANFAAGQTQEDQIIAIIASDEYFNLAPVILGLNATPSYKTYVDAAYLQLFPGYTITQAAENAYVNAMQTGTLRVQVAAGLVHSTLYLFGSPPASNVTIPNNGFIERAYQQYLGRAISAGELSFWESVYAGNPGYATTTFLAALFDSSEYLLKTHQFP